ncbi:MAG: hypothetical protein D6698_12035 [Gammaproteobacteria bacterium]|nr:MAG: hypothetical protein D6698_12035 [Gammaproteobacteria bacterium]
MAYEVVKDLLGELLKKEFQQPMAVETPQYQVPAYQGPENAIDPQSMALINAGAALGTPLRADKGITLPTVIGQAVNAYNTTLQGNAEAQRKRQLEELMLQAQLDQYAEKTASQKKERRIKDTEANLRRAQTLGTLEEAEARKEAAKAQGKGGVKPPADLLMWDAITNMLYQANPTAYGNDINNARAAALQYYYNLKNKMPSDMVKTLDNLALIFPNLPEESQQSLMKVWPQMLQTMAEVGNRIPKSPLMPGETAGMPTTGGAVTTGGVPPITPEELQTAQQKIQSLPDDQLVDYVKKDFTAFVVAAKMNPEYQNLPLSVLYEEWKKLK